MMTAVQNLATEIHVFVRCIFITAVCLYCRTRLHVPVHFTSFHLSVLNARIYVIILIHYGATAN